MPARSRHTTRLVTLTVLLGALSCGDSDLVGPSAETLDAQRALWAAARMRSYAYDLRRAGGFVVELSIVVKQGVVSSAINKGTGELLSATELASVPTIDGLFDLIEDYQARQAFRLEVSFHDTLGYPEMIFVDFEALTDDDELSTVVTSGPVAFEDG